MSLYIDTSCLLKLLFDEPESPRVARIVEHETNVIVSTLAEVEVSVRLQRLQYQKLMTASAAKHLRSAWADLLRMTPFERVALDGEVFAVALAQTQRTRGVYCKSLDRLHLAAAEIASAKRFLTNDDIQAKAARALGFEVIRPRLS